jgi:hypothetical protein
MNGLIFQDARRLSPLAVARPSSFRPHPVAPSWRLKRFIYWEQEERQESHQASTSLHTVIGNRKKRWTQIISIEKSEVELER